MRRNTLEVTFNNVDFLKLYALQDNPQLVFEFGLKTKEVNVCGAGFDLKSFAFIYFLICGLFCHVVRRFFYMIRITLKLKTGLR
jgi:hypothetical protein